jgi:hypothetical protein
MNVSTLVVDLGLGFLIGLTLGLLGGGGSILTVPALVYIVGQPPQAAVTTSLAIVGANSAVGAYLHRGHGAMNWRVALLFGGVGMPLAYLAGGVSKQIAPNLLLVAFALLMLVVGIVLLRGQRQPSAHAQSGDGQIPLLKVVTSGAVVGVVTGILGVGGGFLIVPALVMWVGLPMHLAVGTSLLIIAMNSAAGFIGHVSSVPLDTALTGIFVAAGMVGTIAGARLGLRLDADRLRRLFAWFVIGLAVVLLIQNLLI